MQVHTVSQKIFMSFSTPKKLVKSNYTRFFHKIENISLPQKFRQIFNSTSLDMFFGTNFFLNFLVHYVLLPASELPEPNLTHMKKNQSSIDMASMSSITEQYVLAKWTLALTDTKFLRTPNAMRWRRRHLGSSNRKLQL